MVSIADHFVLVFGLLEDGGTSKKAIKPARIRAFGTRWRTHSKFTIPIVLKTYSLPHHAKDTSVK
jgi:hypothetical protein